MTSPDPSAEATRQYMTGQLRASHPELLARFEQKSREARAALSPALEIAYGPHPRQRFDFFAGPQDAPTLAYLHAGYWQSRDKASFHFLAAPWVAAGFSVALVNYPLCPEVDMATLTEAVRAFPSSFLDHMNRLGRSPALLMAGHSAGAHLAVELALTDGRTTGAVENPLRAVIGLSGVYNLAPLVGTPLNDKLKLDPAAARAASPIHRILPGLPPALFAVGGAETPAFLDQNEAMARAWTASGNIGEILVVEDADHFSLLDELTLPGAPLYEAVLALGRQFIP